MELTLGMSERKAKERIWWRKRGGCVIIKKQTRKKKKIGWCWCDSLCFTFHYTILKTLSISVQIPPPILGIFTSEIAALTISRWQNRKLRPNRPTNNGDMNEKGKHFMSEGVCEIYLFKSSFSLSKKIMISYLYLAKLTYTRMTTFIKTKFKKSDEQTNIE